MAEAVAVLEEGNRLNESTHTFRRDVIAGLSCSKKALSPKYFYDDQGSQYFDEICQLEEYYPYKTELALLPKVAGDLGAYFQKPISVVEFGAGSLLKIRPLLKSISHVSEFIPIDISGDHLSKACRKLQKDFPNVVIKGMEGDFSQRITLPNFSGERLGFFPGSTIGNFTPDEAEKFLHNARLTLEQGVKGQSARLLIGVDTKKSPAILHHAYNDRHGVTEKFNKNILHRINREADANIPVESFHHYAFYNPEKGRIEMHLVSNKKQSFTICDQDIFLKQGESIHTECSYKYSPDDFKVIAAKSGWSIEKLWLADNDMFSMFLLKSVS